MNSFLFFVVLVLILITIFFVWRYQNLKTRLNEFARSLRQGSTSLSEDSKELETLSSAVTSLISTFNVQHSTLESERSRLATVLEQITDGVLIADAQGLIRFANPAAGRLFQFGNPINHTIAEVVRHHQLVEAWRRCQQTRQMQSESV